MKGRLKDGLREEEDEKNERRKEGMVKLLVVYMIIKYFGNKNNVSEYLVLFSSEVNFSDPHITSFLRGNPMS